MRGHGRTAARKAATAVLLALLSSPSAAVALEDHSHGEGDFLWSCGIALAAWLSVAAFAANWFAQIRLPQLSDLMPNLPSWGLGASPPAVEPPAKPATAAEPGVTVLSAEESTREIEPLESETEPPTEQVQERPASGPVKPEKEQGVAGDQKFRWNSTTKRLEIRAGDTWVEAGKGGGWVGRGGGPGHDPFGDPTPQVLDAKLGGVDVHRRFETYSATARTGDSGRRLTLTHDSSTGATSVKRGDFEASVSGDAYRLQDRVDGRTTGATFDDRSHDFEVFRGNFRLGRQGETWSAQGGPEKGGWRLQLGEGGSGSVLVGDRGLVRDEDGIGYLWGKRGVAYDPQSGSGGVTFPIQGGKGSLALGAGRGGQFAYDGTHAVRVFGRDARLHAAYERFLESNASGVEEMKRESALGLDVGRVSVRFEESGGDIRRTVRYNVDF